MKKQKMRDFDPEELLNPAPSDSDEINSDEESIEEFQTGREHYADVGTSKLRKREVVPLGPQYEGSRISREAALDEDSDDPFASQEFREGSSDEESDSSMTNGNGFPDHVDRSEEEEEDPEEGMDEAEEDGVDGFEEQGEDDVGEVRDDITNRAKLRKIMNEEQKTVTATISQAAKADAEKGQAVKAQRKTSDSFLNTRIRLQKALISINSMASSTYENSTVGEHAMQAAETAALSLLTTLTTLRSTIDSARTGTKRKRPAPLTPFTPSSTIWATIKTAETANHPHRNAILDKWSQKTKATPILPSSRRLNNASQQTLIDVLSTHLSDTQRLVKRTQIPRSCAPLQSTSNVPSSPSIYDDADFYGLLLKELLEQRSQDATTMNGTGAALIVQAPWQASREAKTKKVVDTRASKGRKLRYTVHEKLQNFMAPEERGIWGERQIDELFGSLFGRKLGLGEDVEEDVEVSADEEEGLMLFRS